MDTNINPEQIDLEYLLPRDAYRHLMFELHNSLPLTTNNTPEENPSATTPRSRRSPA